MISSCESCDRSPGGDGGSFFGTVALELLKVAQWTDKLEILIANGGSHYDQRNSLCDDVRNAKDTSYELSNRYEDDPREESTSVERNRGDGIDPNLDADLTLPKTSPDDVPIERTESETGFTDKNKSQLTFSTKQFFRRFPSLRSRRVSFAKIMDHLPRLCLVFTLHRQNRGSPYAA